MITLGGCFSRIWPSNSALEILSPHVSQVMELRSHMTRWIVQFAGGTFRLQMGQGRDSSKEIVGSACIEAAKTNSNDRYMSFWREHEKWVNLALKIDQSMDQSLLLHPESPLRD